MRQTILVPLVYPRRDPERVSESALPLARALASRSHASLVLLSVLEPVFDLADLPETELDRPETIARRKQEVEAYLRQVASTFAELHTQVVVRIGDPAEEILTQADLLAQPVIVLASHSRSGMHRLVLGSVAFQVVRRATCPVLVVPAWAGDGARTTHALDRLLVPLDGSPLAECALDCALATLGTSSLHLHLVRVVEPPGRLAGPADRRNHVAAQRGASEYLSDVAERLRFGGASVTWEVRSGSVAEEIERAARERAVGLIALSTHGRSSFGRVFSGSVAERLAQRQHTPLLICRPSEAAVAEHLRAVRSGEWPSRPQAAEQHPPTPRLTAVDIMSAPVITAPADATLEDIARTMLSYRIGCVPIVDERGQLIGIVTESDFTGRQRGVPFSLYRAPQLFGRWLTTESLEEIYATGRSLTAGQIMHAPVITAREDDSVTSIVERLIQYDISRIPVVRDGIPVGIVARHDLLKLLVSAARPSEPSHQE